VAGGVALAVGAGVPGVALAKTPAKPKAPTKPKTTSKTKTPALPAFGDWEGTGAGGTTASFEVAVASAPTHAKRSGKPSSTKPSAKKPSTKKPSTTTYRVVEDFAVDAPIACTNSSQPAIPFDVEVVDGPLRVAKNGTFSSGAIKDGAGTALSGRVNGSRITIAYRHVSSTPNQFAGGTEVCDTGTIQITATPGHRTLLTDGIWSGETQTNEPVVFYVAAGGRAIEAPGHPPSNGSPQASFTFGQFTQTCSQGGCFPSSVDICAYESPISLFVAADGVFNNNQWQDGGDDPIVAGTFSDSSHASGQFANGPNACAQTPWTAEAG
jgi:hypothetical protein